MQLTRKIIMTVLVCGVTGAFVAGCGEQPPAGPAPSATPGPSATVGEVPPGQELASFRRALSMRGLPTGTNDEETTRYAQTICSELDRGSPPQQVILDVQAGTGYSLEDTGYVVGAGLSSFCPQNLAKLR